MVKTTVTAIGMLTLLVGPNAQAKIGAVGDSISTAFNADDQCSTLLNCAGRIGEDRGYSWTTGYAMSQSIRKRLGQTTSSEHQKNGARWDDAKVQAQALLGAGGAQYVTVEMGGNDVCRKLGETLPTKAEIASHVEATFSTLANGLASGSKVVVAEVPDVVRLYTTMRAQKNFLFESCQDLWDLNTDRLAPNTCDWGFFDFVCDAADFILRTTADYVSPLTDAMMAAFNVEFPCGVVLRSASNDTNRSLARALNNDINSVLAEKVARWNGYRGVSFVLAANVSEFQFTARDVSQLDCFHPSRQGQANLATTVWNGASLGTSGSLVADKNAPAMVADTSYAWWAENNSAIYATFQTTEGSRLEVWTENCYNSANACYDYCFEGTTNENPPEHEIHKRGLDYRDYWRLWLRPSDVAGNVGSWHTTSCM